MVSAKPPRDDMLAEASYHGFAEGPPKMVVKALLKKCVLAEAMLVKSPKMVVKPLMPKSLAEVKPM